MEHVPPFASCASEKRSNKKIAKTCEQVGLTPQIFTGAADLYRFVSKNHLALRRPEDPDLLPGLTEMISLLADV